MRIVNACAFSCLDPTLPFHTIQTAQEGLEVQIEISDDPIAKNESAQDPSITIIGSSTLKVGAFEFSLRRFALDILSVVSCGVLRSYSDLLYV